MRSRRASPDGVTGIVIDRITGDDNRLPREALRNTASVAAQALLRSLGERRGVVLSIARTAASSGPGGSGERRRRGGRRRCASRRTPRSIC